MKKGDLTTTIVVRYPLVGVLGHVAVQSVVQSGLRR